MSVEAEVSSATDVLFETLLSVLRRNGPLVAGDIEFSAQSLVSDDVHDVIILVGLDRLVYSIWFQEFSEISCLINAEVSAGSRTQFLLSLPTCFTGSTRQALPLFMHRLATVLRGSSVHRIQLHRRSNQVAERLAHGRRT